MESGDPIAAFDRWYERSGKPSERERERASNEGLDVAKGERVKTGGSAGAGRARRGA